MNVERPSGEIRVWPTVSIITVCFNSARTIRETIDSVITQEYPTIQYIIVDGGSVDGTVDIVREYDDQIDIFICEPDHGIYDAMNKGIRAATGDVVGMLNSDDFYTDPHAVSDLMGALCERDVDAVFADLVYVDQVDTSRVCRYYDSGRWRPSRFRFGWMPAHPTFFIKREWYERYGLFSLDYRIAADFEMLVRLLHTGRASYTYVARPIVKMRRGGTSTSGFKHSLLLNREIVRACRDNGIWTTLLLVLLKIPAKLLEIVPGRRDLGGTQPGKAGT